MNIVICRFVLVLLRLGLSDSLSDSLILNAKLRQCQFNSTLEIGKNDTHCITTPIVNNMSRLEKL